MIVEDARSLRRGGLFVLSAATSSKPQSPSKPQSLHRSRKMSATRCWRLVVEYQKSLRAARLVGVGPSYPMRRRSGYLLLNRESLDQRSNQTQEFLLLWSIAGCNEERSDVNVSHLAAGGKIRLMPDDYPPSIRVVSEQPPVPVSAAVNLSSPNGHAKFAPCSTLTI